MADQDQDTPTPRVWCIPVLTPEELAKGWEEFKC